jgi:hypothetical protein
MAGSTIGKALAGAALATIVSAMAVAGADATTLTLTNPPGQSDTPYNVVFAATGSESEVLVSGYQVPWYEYVTNNVVQLVGGGPNLLDSSWTLTRAAQGSFAGTENDSTPVPALWFGGTQPPYMDTFSQIFPTVAGSLYEYQFSFSNDFWAPAPSQLVVTFQSATAAPEASTWAMMLAGFAGLGFTVYRARRTAISIG